MSCEDLDELEERDNDQECDKEQEQLIRGFAQSFHSDVDGLVRFYIGRFFEDKMLHCGGKIPKSLLFNERRISMVLNYDICQGVDRAYKYLKNNTSDGFDDDIKMVTQILNLLARSGIPQQLAGGMLCLYLEFVEGVNIGTEF
jgi:hypothetical protein